MTVETGSIELKSEDDILENIPPIWKAWAKTSRFLFHLGTRSNILLTRVQEVLVHGLTTVLFSQRDLWYC